MDLKDVEEMGRSWAALPIHLAISIACLVWAVVLGALWLFPCWSLDFKKQGADRMLGTINALVTATWAACVQLSTQPVCDPLAWWIEAPMLIIIGYLIVDLISMLLCDVWHGWRPVDRGMVFHHLLIIALFVVGCAHNVGIWFGTTLCINELSTPFFTLFWYLQYIDKKESTLFVVNGLAFVAMFFFCRIVYIPINAYQFASVGLCKESPNLSYRWGSWAMALAYIPMYILNLFWFIKLATGCLKKLQGEAKNEESDDETNEGKSTMSLRSARSVTPLNSPRE